MTEPSLYDRIGGVNAIAMVVDRFSDEIVKNAKLNVNPALKKWNQTDQLAGLKFMLDTLALPSGRRTVSIHRQGAGRSSQGSPHQAGRVR